MQWTDKQIETYLEDETRKLTFSDGKSVRITMYHMQWITFDAVRVDDIYTEAQLIDWASQLARDEGGSFTDAFRHNMDRLDHEFRRQNGQL